MASNWFDRLRTGLGMEVEEPEPAEVGNQTLLSQLDEATTLTRTQRAVGFALCAGLGLLLSFLAPLFVLRPVKFAMVYTLGNLLAIGSSLFLAGPSKQWANMWHSKRRLATLLYLVSIFGTLASALALHSALLCILFIVLQTCALLWYCLSYIPYGHAMVMRFAGRHFDEAGGQW